MNVTSWKMPVAAIGLSAAVLAAPAPAQARVYKVELTSVGPAF